MNSVFSVDRKHARVNSAINPFYEAESQQTDEVLIDFSRQWQGAQREVGGAALELVRLPLNTREKIRHELTWQTADEIRFARVERFLGQASVEVTNLLGSNTALRLKYWQDLTPSNLFDMHERQDEYHQVQILCEMWENRERMFFSRAVDDARARVQIELLPDNPSGDPEDELARSMRGEELGRLARNNGEYYIEQLNLLKNITEPAMRQFYANAGPTTRLWLTSMQQIYQVYNAAAPSEHEI